MELVIATYNLGKVREVEQALQKLPVRLRHLSDFKNVSTVAEIGKTYQENAVLKAVGYARQTGVFALADDSGLEVDEERGLCAAWHWRVGKRTKQESLAC